MESNNKVGFLIAILLVVSVISISYSVLHAISDLDSDSESDYTCIVADFQESDIESSDSLSDSAYIYWEYTTVNQTLIQNLINEGYCDESYLSFEEGAQLEWNICLDDNTDDFWEIGVRALSDSYNSENYYGSNDSEECYDCYDYSDYDYYYYSICKDPEIFASFWFSKAQSSFTKFIIPYDVETYLSEFENNIPSNETNKYKIVESSSIYEDMRGIGLHGHSELVYNKEGILKQYILYYDNEIALDMQLSDYYIDKSYYNNENFLIIIVIIVIIFVVIAPLSAIAQSEDKKRKNQLIKKESPGKSVEKLWSDKNISTPSNLSTKYCTNCKKALAENHLFCNACGKFIYSEVKFCAYCGALKLSNAIFCHKCGNTLKTRGPVAIDEKEKALNINATNLNKSVKKICVMCGCENNNKNRYCQTCGNKFL